MLTNPENKWNYHSAVTPCPPCDGKGAAPNRPWLSNGDPDCWDVECEACEGVGHHACAVCGFDHSIPGYDCLICEAVATIRRLRASQPRHERSALAGAAMLGTALASWGAALWMVMA